jgi:hypothetical protein
LTEYTVRLATGDASLAFKTRMQLEHSKAVEQR